jgi:hypothetical protein
LVSRDVARLNQPPGTVPWRAIVARERVTFGYIISTKDFIILAGLVAIDCAYAVGL